MSKHLSAIEELLALKAEFESRTQQIKSGALTELNARLKAAKAEVDRIEGEIAELTVDGFEAKAAETTPTAKRLKPMVEGSEEWNKVAKQIAIVLQNNRGGLNGKELASKLGLTIPRDIKRILPVIAATTIREGAGIATKYYLK